MLVQNLAQEPDPRSEGGCRQRAALHGRQHRLSCWLLLPEPVPRCPAALRGCPLPSAIPGHLCPRGRRPLRRAALPTRPAPPQPHASGRREDGAGTRGRGDADAAAAASTGAWLRRRPAPWRRWRWLRAAVAELCGDALAGGHPACPGLSRGGGSAAAPRLPPSPSRPRCACRRLPSQPGG